MEVKELIKLLRDNGVDGELVCRALHYKEVDFENNEELRSFFGVDETLDYLSGWELVDVFNEKLEELTIPRMEITDQFGGSGKGDEYYIIINFPELNIYLKSDAWFASYHGASDFEEWYSVKPVEKTIITYQKN